MSTQFDFSDRVVLVTGASGALGSATVEAFTNAGGIVCANARHRPDDDPDGPFDDARVHFYGGDFTDESTVEQVLDSVIDDHGRLDVLCPLIGTWRGGTPLDETDIDTFEFLLDVNLKSMFLASKHALTHLRDTNGTIVSVSSRSSLRGGEGDGSYRAAKAGVRLLTETIAEENAGRVRANAVMPSIIDTPANREAMSDSDFESWPTPAEIARVMLFLCSDDASVTSGAAVPVYGET